MPKYVGTVFATSTEASTPCLVSFRLVLWRCVRLPTSSTITFHPPLVASTAFSSARESVFLRMFDAIIARYVLDYSVNALFDLLQVLVDWDSHVNLVHVRSILQNAVQQGTEDSKVHVQSSSNHMC